MAYTDAVQNTETFNIPPDKEFPEQKIKIGTAKLIIPKNIPNESPPKETVVTRPDEPDFLDQQKSNELKIQLAWKDIYVWPVNEKPTAKVVPLNNVQVDKVESFENRVKNKDNITEFTGGKQILKGVSGCVNPGQFLAIIGSTGAGKTTLLQYLSGKMFAESLEARGDIYMNGIERDKIEYTRFTAFVQQDDILMETLTIRESLEFAANVKSPGTYEERQQRVNSLLKELELITCADYYFSDDRVRKGEKKRASMGVELITNPALIFLDEPTTGMDSYTAMKIVQLMKKLALKGRTVVTTIHQPNSDIFENFDQLMILSLGKIIYFVFLSLFNIYRMPQIRQYNILGILAMNALSTQIQQSIL